MPTPITIDGSQGEGGGQIVRTALGLSLVTGTPFRIDKLRARRARPGLMRQHLTAVQAAAAIGGATVEGASVGSQQLSFQPRDVVPGEYRFSIGTAGSATLVLQTVLPALLRARAPSRLVLEGGTHNPLAPTFDFLDRAFLPLLRRMGVSVDATLERVGFYPAGGGRFEVAITPASTLSPLHLLERGEIRARRATALFAALPFTVARRELDTVRQRLGWDPACCHPREIVDSAGPGNVVEVEIESEPVTELFTAFGERGRRAESVGEAVAAEAAEYLDAGVPVGRHLADQLLLPLALAGAGSFRTLTPSSHTRTQIDIIGRFLEVPIRCDSESPRVWRVQVG